ncbi:MAG: transcriptional repressor [Deltaproteobacteria bacterium RIFOXYD12_FULL_50_9]|nr:MAG: transcriptional repressor [Deltaproteobacteria bacterium RIFOXYD12_FULL_50_9]
MSDANRMRMTKQRQIILEELKKVTSHPTADEVYQMVRRRMPKISLGTVYRNLEILAGLGHIQKLSVGGTQKRFDGDISLHSHIRCRDCGRVADLNLKLESHIETEAARFTDFVVLGHHLEFIGICPECQ